MWGKDSAGRGWEERERRRGAQGCAGVNGRGAACHGGRGTVGGVLDRLGGKLPAEGEALFLDPTTFDSPALLALRLVAIWTFFFALLRSLPSISPKAAAAHAAIHSPILGLLVPPRLGFTYVQTALLAVAAAHELLRSDKDHYYDVASLAINLPVGFVAWLEALACDSVLGQQRLTYKAMGGHWLYDGTINLSMFACYAIVLARREKES